MSAAGTSWAAPELARLGQRLAPYARETLERGVSLAARLHADEVSPEHWLAALLADEECAATRAVLHAFADPETIGIEVLAQCSGIMVVGSGRTLPFSVRALSALRAARAGAHRRGASSVEPADLLPAAAAELPDALRAKLAPLPETETAGNPSTGEVRTSTVSEEGPLFRRYSTDGLRALGAACRTASSLHRAAIGPLHLCLGCLEVDAALCERSGWSAGRLRLAAAGADADETPLPQRTLAGDARLLELFPRLPPAAETLDVLGALLEHGTEELLALLRRQKVTLALFERCRGVFRDPPGPPDATTG